MNDLPYDVAIVGGGIVGAACAFYAARDGLRVYACDRGAAGGGTTGTGSGHIVAMDAPPEMLALTRYSQRLWQELAPSLPATACYRERGTIWTARSEAELGELDEKESVFRSAGVPTERLDPGQLRVAEPLLVPDLAGGLRVPEDALVEPVAATEFLWRSARARGARVEPHRAVRRLRDGVVEFSDGSEVRAQEIVNAAGVDAPELSPTCAIEPRRGHLLRLGPAPGALSHAVVEVGYTGSTRSDEPVSVAFNAQPQVDGSILLGSSRERGVRDPGVDPAVIDRVRERARSFAPRLAALPTLEVRSGVRPATADHRPWIGRLPGTVGQWVAAGHEGLGITASLGTGRIIADLLKGRPAAIPIAGFSPTRARSPSAATRLAGADR